MHLKMCAKNASPKQSKYQASESTSHLLKPHAESTTWWLLADLTSPRVSCTYRIERLETEDRRKAHSFV